MTPPRGADGTAAAVSQQHPWLGLSSFGEDTRAYFFGREEEVAELARRVQRKLLTVLFGQSGLGKTSILRAGIVPRLREQGYCPVYVRIDYGTDAPPAAAQIKQAIRAATAHGSWSRAGIASDDESLWEFLHHRDDVLSDAAGATVLPLLIFDQFEEIFTLAQGDDEGRRRAADFIAGLAELVENRPSAELEARLEDDDSAIDRFDFARTDYRVLIALREDYLAHLENLKGAMPSITQNRMRLAPMTGQQALAAVTGPGAALVTDEVAQAIVRFVAGGAELAHAQVEPSLLSLICRELNDKRIAAGRDAITLDLLAGSHASILSDFYQRALADQPPAVRNVIEDLLLTESGYRENVAAERVLSAFAAAGADGGALATLVDRRLLRIEERLDVRRVELTHDVLCAVIGASRAQRQEREAHAATARNLAEQRERERATRRTLVRTRQVALVCALLGMGAIGASLYAVSASRDAEQARGQAENLIGYLSEDFARELKGSGRHSVVAELGRRTLAYYNGLSNMPPGSDTERNRANAMIDLGITLRSTAELDAADRLFTQAQQLLTARMAAGDRSEATASAAAHGLFGLGLSNMSRLQFADAVAHFQQAIALIGPYANAPGAGEQARRRYAESQTYLAFMLGSRVEGHVKEGVAAAEEARSTFAGLGALALRDVSDTIGYAEATTYGAFALHRLGRNTEASERQQQSIALLKKVLAVQPNHFRALETHADASDGLGLILADSMQLASGLKEIDQSRKDYTTLTTLNPSSANLWWNLSFMHNTAADMLIHAGQVAQARQVRRMAFEAATLPKPGSPSLRQVASEAANSLAELTAAMGERNASDAALAQGKAILDGCSGIERSLLHAQWSASAMLASLYRDDAAGATAIARQALAQLDAAKGSAADTLELNHMRFGLLTLQGMALYAGQDFTGAEKSLRAAMAVPTGWFTDSAREAWGRRADVSTWLAMALARQQRLDEARKAVAADLAHSRELAKTNVDDNAERVRLAGLLYAYALGAPDDAGATLREAQATITALPAEMRTLRPVEVWRAGIAAAQQGKDQHGR
ncbi:MAG: hypothetical protein V4463_07065 [Pseudomonadota bacterium]